MSTPETGTTEAPPVFVRIVEVVKPGTKIDKAEETFTPPQGAPVVGGMYIYRWVTALLGERLKITVEKADE